MANDVRINIITNRSGDSLDAIRRDIARVADATEQMAARTAQASRQTEQVNQQQGLSWAVLAGKVYLAQEAYQQVRRAADLALDTLKEGAALELAESRFERLAASIGTTSDALLTRMREATKGMVSDAQLIAGANDLIGLKLARNQEEVLRFSRLIGELDWDMQQLTLTIANQSTKRLDALGLSVEDVENKMHALEQQGFATEEAFRLALLEAGEERLALIGTAADSTVGDVRRLEAAWDDTVDAFKQEFSVRAAEEIDWKGVTQDVRDLASASATLAGWLVEIVSAMEWIGRHTPAALLARGTRGAVGAARDLLGEQEFATHPAGFEAQSAAMSESAQAAALVAASQEEARREIRATSQAIGEQAGTTAAAAGETEKWAELNRLLAAAEEELRAEQMAVAEAYEARREGIELTAEDVEVLTEAEREAAEAAEELNQAIANVRLQGISQQMNLVDEWAVAFQELSEAQGTWVTGTINNAGEVAAVNQRLATDLSSEQRDAWQDILDTAEEGSRQYLEAYNNLANDLSEAQRQKLVVERAELQAAQGGLAQFYTGDIEAATEAQEELDRIWGEMAQTWGTTTSDIIGINDEAFTEIEARFLVAAGLMDQQVADMRLDVVELGGAFEEIGNAVREGEISPEQGAELFSGLLEGFRSGKGEVEELIAEMQADMQSFSSGEWITDLGGVDPSSGLGRAILPELEQARDELQQMPKVVDVDYTAVTETGEEADSLAEKLGVAEGPWTVQVNDGEVGAAIDVIDTLKGRVDQLDGRTIDLYVQTHGDTTIQEPEPVNVGHQHGTGGLLRVPPGFPDDSYRVGLTSGEVYNVWTPGQARQAMTEMANASDGEGQSGGDTYYISIIVDGKRSDVPANADKAEPLLRAARGLGVPV